MLFGIRFRHAGMIVLVVVLALSYTMVLNAPGYAQTYNWTRNDPGSGFGDTNNVTIYSMAVYGGKLYAGTENNVSGTEIWSYDGSAWTQANVDGFGDANNNRSYSMAVFSGKLYVGVWNASTGAQVWSYDGSTWSQANVSGFGNPSNGGVFSLAVHGGSLYAGTGASVADVYAYDGSNWTQVSSGGFGDAGNTYCYCLADYNGSLYAGTMNYTSGIQVYRYDAPGWTQVNVSGFGDGANNLCHSMAEYGGRLYVGTANFATGTEVWSYDGSTWTQVNSDGYGSAANVTSRSMVVYRGRLYLGTQNDTAGGGVWDYDGSTWTQANNAGFGDTNNKRCYGLAAYNDHLYVGTKNSAGTQVWRNNAPVLEVIKSAVPTQVNAGGTIDYSIALTNSGDADATGVLLTDQIPQYTSVAAGSCTCSDPGATINSENPVDVSGITVGQSATVTVDFSVTVDADVPDATLISNQAFIRGDGVTTPSSDPQHPGLGQPTLVLARRAAPVKPAGSTTWYLAEGSTGSDESGSFESWVLVQNAGNVAAGVDLYYQTPTGEVAGPHLNIAAHTRQTVNVADTVPNQWSVSTRVVSNNPVIAERAMYWNSGEGVYRQAATDSIGVDP